jgi:hypothetical protein
MNFIKTIKYEWIKIGWYTNREKYKLVFFLWDTIRKSATSPLNIILFLIFKLHQVASNHINFDWIIY